MLKARVIIGIVLAVVLSAVFVGDYLLADRTAVDWAPGFYAAVGLAAVAGLGELCRMIAGRDWAVNRVIVLGGGLLVLAGPAVRAATGFEPVLRAGPVLLSWPAWSVAAVVVALLLAEMVRVIAGGDVAVGLPGVGLGTAGVLYVSLMLLFVVAIRSLERPGGLWCVAVFIAVAKSSDIGAYFTGRAIGRHKLVPKLSPGKTIEGAVGGLALAVGVAVAMGVPLLGLEWWQAVVFALAVAPAAMAGDLVVSLWKRATAVKDSGQSLPGFGGVMDIIDSVLLPAPVAYGLLVAFGATHGG